MKSYFVKALLYSIVISTLIIVYTTFVMHDGTNTKSLITKAKYIKNIMQAKTVNKLSELIKVVNNQKIFIDTNVGISHPNANLKYILQWTSDENVPFVDMGKGQNGFINRNCRHVNCFVTSDKFLLEGDYTKFDVIAFAGPELAIPRLYDIKLPEKRSEHQKYVFASIESPQYYHICNDNYNNVFNWTWTYKLDSDVRWGYIIVRDKQHNEIIGPRSDMTWLKVAEMDPVPEEYKEKLKTKKKAAAWFVSNCDTISRREDFVLKLQMELYKYKHVVDIYGNCGILSCSADNQKKCNAKISKTYYFYLAFENALSEDYVTEKVLLGLNNDAVPIVYGGANYTRFMPDGAYLNAMEFGVKKLAAKVNELIENHEEYANYFRWKNHYWYHKTTEFVETNEYCKMCELLNDQEAINKTTVCNNFRDWWNPHGMSC